MGPKRGESWIAKWVYWLAIAGAWIAEVSRRGENGRPRAEPEPKLCDLVIAFVNCVLFTVPQKGCAKRGSKKMFLLSDLKVT